MINWIHNKSKHKGNATSFNKKKIAVIIENLTLIVKCRTPNKVAE